MDLKQEVSHCGFLPNADPLKKLPSEFAALEEIAATLPKLLLSDQLRKRVAELPALNIEILKSPAELERAMLLLSFIGHAYVWGASMPADTIPLALAKPWFEVATQLQRPPVLSYASYALHNWFRLDPARPIALGNIALLQNFLGGIDEEWFVLVHVEIEAIAAKAMSAIIGSLNAIAVDDAQQLLECMQQMAIALQKMNMALERMPENCDPYIYYQRVRPYIHGWKDNPSLPHGIIYEGCYGNQPQKFRGETGAQSAIVPALDAALSIQHQPDILRVYLLEMRDYMPIEHRRFIEDIEKQSTIRDYVLKHYHAWPMLREYYNECVQWLTHFRETHLRYAAHYIQKQTETSLANSTTTGTGGTPFMTYLRKHKDECEATLI